MPSAVPALMARAAKLMATAIVAYVKTLSVHRVRTGYKMELRPVSIVVVITALVAQTEIGVRLAATVPQAVASLNLRCLDRGRALQDLQRGKQPRR